MFLWNLECGKIGGISNMKIKDIQKYLMDDVVIYQKVKDESGEYADLYSGNATNIPANILDMELRVIGAKIQGNILDVQVMND